MDSRNDELPLIALCQVVGAIKAVSTLPSDPEIDRPGYRHRRGIDPFRNVESGQWPFRWEGRVLAGNVG